MKMGIRTPSIKKSIKARTTGKVKREVKKAIIPTYGQKGTGFIKDPKKATYNKVYNKTTTGCLTSLMVMLVLIVIPILVVGCGATSNKAESNVESDPVVASVSPATKSETKVDDIREIKINEPFQVQTDDGDYSFTIIGVSKTDFNIKDDTTKGKQAILLNYEINNISFKNQYYSGVTFGSKTFIVSDDKNYLINESYNVNDVLYSTKVLPGLKGKFNFAYETDLNTKYVDVVFTRGTINVGKIRIEIK